MNRVRHYFHWTVLTTVFLPGTLSAQVHVQEDEDFSNSAFVRVSDELEADFYYADQKAGEGDWAEAVNAYQRVLDQLSDSVVAFGPRVFVSGFEKARRKLGALPPEALSRYQELFGEKADEARAQALRLFDPSRLIRVAIRYPFTQAATTALRQASSLAFEQGQSPMVTRSVGLLLTRGEARSEDLARLVSVLTKNGDARGIASLHADIEDRLQEKVMWAGEPRTVQELFDMATASSGTISSGAMEKGFSRAPLLVEEFGRFPPGERSHVPMGKSEPMGYVPPRFPAIGGCRTSSGFFASGLLGLYRLEKDKEFRKPDLKYGTAYQIDTEYRELSARSLAPVAADNRVFVVLSESSHSFYGEQDEVGQLVAIDVGSEIRPAWRVSGESLGGVSRPDLTGYIFEGPPVLHGNLVLVSGSRLDTNSECSLFAFDQETGELRWVRFLASASRAVRYEVRNKLTTNERAIPSTVSVSGDVAYCSTNLGIVAAVGAFDGSVRWLFKYNRLKSFDIDAYRRHSIYDTGGWHRSPPYVAGNRLVVTPEDSRFLYVLDRVPSLDGLLCLNDPLFKGPLDALIGVDGRRGQLLFLAQQTVGVLRARTYVCATDLDGGELWRSVPLEIEEYVTGKPLLLADSLFLPTNKALYRMGLGDEGRTQEPIPVPDRYLRANEGWYYGNLSFHGDAILSISPLCALRITVSD